jgi:ubiquinone/menaquinone biosynthesis C-methylase UbiE
MDNRGRNPDIPVGKLCFIVLPSAWEIEPMTTQSAADLDGLKARVKTTWMAGDYSRIATFTEIAANEFIGRRGLRRGMRVLDVACGSGNLALPAAKAGAYVTGVDIAPNLLVQARERAIKEGASIKFEEGDAEDLPYQTGTFDLVVTMFGAMFAPRPEIVANELCRVCRRGGEIAIASWTPTGFIGELFRVTGKHVAPPPGAPSPLLWGDEAVVRARLRGNVTNIKTTKILIHLNLPFTVPETVEFYRLHYGPTLRAFAGLVEAGQFELRRDLEELYLRHNEAVDGTTSIAAEYLEVIAVRA